MSSLKDKNYKLNLTTLGTRRLKGDPTEMFKIFEGLIIWRHEIFLIKNT